MTKPKRKKCQVAGCTSGEPEDNGGAPGPYWSDADCNTIADRDSDLKDHMHMVHELAVQQVAAEASKITAEANKIKAEAEKLRVESREANPGDAGTSARG